MILNYILIIYCIHIIVGAYLFKLGYESLIKQNSQFNDITDNQLYFVMFIFSLIWLPACICLMINSLIKSITNFFTGDEKK